MNGVFEVEDRAVRSAQIAALVEASSGADAVSADDAG